MPVRAYRWGLLFTISFAGNLQLMELPGAGAQQAATTEAVCQPGRVTSFEHANRQLTLKCGAGTLIIKPYADNIINVRYLPGPVRTALSPAPAGKASAEYKVESTLPAIRLMTAQLTASVNRSTAQISFLDAKHNLLVASRSYSLKAAPGLGEGVYSIHAEFAAPDEEAYYGLGQQPGSEQDQRGQTVRLWRGGPAGSGEETAAPFLVTNRNYGFLLDTSSRTTVTPGKDGMTAWDAEAGSELSFFVIFGETIEAINAGYQSLAAMLAAAAPIMKSPDYR